MNKIIKVYLKLIITLTPVISQQAKLDGQFYEYSTYYLSSFDITSGESQVPLFRFRVSSENYPIYVKTKFKISFLSPKLGIESQKTLTELESNIFKMKADIILDNRNYSENTNTLLDEGNPPNIVPIVFKVKDSLNPTEFESIISSILTTGKLPDGEYRLELSLYSGESEFNVSLSDAIVKSVIVESPSGVNLETPGGMLADTAFNMVYTNYPSFNWNKGYCLNCKTYIRVAEFKPSVHSSTEEALRDERTLPFNQSEKWLSISDVSTFQYPISNVRALEFGKIYVWQIKVSIQTTSGNENQMSEVYAFKLASPSGSIAVSEPMINQNLRQSIGEDIYNSFFGKDGDLEGFKFAGNISIDGVMIDEKTLKTILNQIVNQKYSVESVKVEN